MLVIGAIDRCEFEYANKNKKTLFKKNAASTEKSNSFGIYITQKHFIFFIKTWVAKKSQWALNL